MEFFARSQILLIKFLQSLGQHMAGQYVVVQVLKHLSSFEQAILNPKKEQF